MSENEIGTVVVEVATQIHRELGPGLLESVYEVVLAHQLMERGLEVERQVPIPIRFKDLRFDEGFRAALMKEGIIRVVNGPGEQNEPLRPSVPARER